MATEVMSIKLMIDTKSHKVVFAEASKDFVDFLIFLLSLPIGTAIKLFSSESHSPVGSGSLGNIYTSVANLSETYVQPNIGKSLLLNPIVVSSVVNIPLLISRSSIVSSGKLYNCGDSNCKRGATNMVNGAFCPGCSRKMNREMKFIAASDNLITNAAPRINDNDSKGYVKQETSYMVSDDLSVSVISTMSILSTMNKFNFIKLEEKNVEIGNEEAMELLKTAFKSATVLTDVFMKKKEKRKEEEQGESKGFCKERSFSASKTPAKKRKTAKYVKKPKKPPGTFFVFMEEFRKTYKEENPQSKSGYEIAIAGGEKWRQMSEAEKARYEAENDERMIDYVKKLKAYNKSLADGSDHKPRLDSASDSDEDEEDEDEDEDGSGEEDDCVVVS